MSFELSVFPNTPNLHKIVLHEIDMHLDIYDTIKIVIIVWFQFTPQISWMTEHRHQWSLECSMRGLARPRAVTVKPVDWITKYGGDREHSRKFEEGNESGRVVTPL